MTERHHEFDLPLPPDAAFPLFTPRGEESWVPGWRPEYLDPADGETRAEMVFLTGEGAGRTIWTCLAFDPAHHHARYLRVTPATRLAFVDVQCRARGQGSRVAVSYRYLPLTGAGNAEIAGITETSFAAMIDGWRDLILARLPEAA